MVGSARRLRRRLRQGCRGLWRLDLDWRDPALIEHRSTHPRLLQTQPDEMSKELTAQLCRRRRIASSFAPVCRRTSGILATAAGIREPDFTEQRVLTKHSRIKRGERIWY